MIVTFQSQAAGDVIMFGDVARRMMEIMGKDPSDKGILTVEQLPDAILQEDGKLSNRGIAAAPHRRKADPRPLADAHVLAKSRR